MKYIFTFVLCLGLFTTSSSFGQEETKKVVVIKKVVDDNGKSTTERTEASGEEADKLIEALKKDDSLEGLDLEIEIEKAMKSGGVKKEAVEDISIEKTIENGKEMTTYKIVTEKDGEKRVTVWKGDNDEELPAEIAEKLKGIDIKTNKSSERKTMMITVETDDEDTEIQKSNTIEKRIKIKSGSDNKVTLGVMIEDDSEGIIISEIVDDSVAEKAGLKSGDTILKINDTYVFNTRMLLNALSKFDKGDKIKVTYLRDSKEEKTDAAF